MPSLDFKFCVGISIKQAEFKRGSLVVAHDLVLETSDILLLFGAMHKIFDFPLPLLLEIYQNAVIALRTHPFLY